MNFLELCRQIIAIDSTPTQGNYELVRFLADVGTRLGLSVEVQEAELQGQLQANIIIRTRPRSAGQNEFLLLSHLDTVEPGIYSNWTMTGSNPFNATIYQNRIYGLGAAEVKLDFLCKLQSLYELRQAHFKTSPVLVGTFGEEIGMHGALKLVRKKMVNAKYALIGEPTQLRVVHAGKGIAVIDITIPFSSEEVEYRTRHDLQMNTSTQSKIFSGKAGHSSHPDSGENAIEKMLSYLDQLPEGIAIMEMDGGLNHNTIPASAILEIDFVGTFKNPISQKIKTLISSIKSLEEKFKSIRSPGFVPDYMTINIGMVRTTDDSIQMRGCCRLPPGVEEDQYKKWMNELAEVCQQLGAFFSLTDYRAPFSTSTESPFVKGCQSVLERLQLETATSKVSVCTEASILSRFGIECLLFGPAQSLNNSHSPNENVQIEELETAKSFYRGVIENFCL